MAFVSLYEDLKGNPYPGRGIILGMADESRAAAVYFIMGRSANSRNRYFLEEGSSLRACPVSEEKVEDASLIFYSPMRLFGNRLILTNGDQTDTVYEGFSKGLDFAASLQERTYEPDAPNFTPRISGTFTLSKTDASYVLSILKKEPGEGEGCQRFFYQYEKPAPGRGHFIHTYRGDGDPLPSFTGEPKAILIERDIDSFAGGLWDSLQEENRISLFVRYYHLETGETETRIMNQYR